MELSELTLRAAVYWLVVVNLILWIVDPSLLFLDTSFAFFRWLGTVAILLLSAVIVASRKSMRGIGSPLLLMLLAVGVLSSDRFLASIAEYLRLAACIGLFTLLRRSAKFSQAAYLGLKHVTQFFVLGSTILLVMSDASFASEVDRTRYAGLAAHPNILSFTAAVALCFAVGRIAHVATPRWSKFPALLMAGCSIFCIYASDSRAGFAMVVLLLVYAGVSRIRQKKPLQLSMRSLLIMLVGATVLPLFMLGGTLSFESDSFQRQLSVVERVLAWERAVEIFASHPFVGGGLATTFDIADSAKAEGLLYAHNAYLTYAARMGLVGVLAFTLVLLVIARGIRVGISSSVWDSRRVVATSLLIVAIPFFAIDGGLQGIQVSQYVLAIALACLLGRPDQAVIVPTHQRHLSG